MELIEHYIKNDNPVLSGENALFKIKSILESIGFALPPVPQNLIEYLYEYNNYTFTTLNDKLIKKTTLDWIEDLEKKPQEDFCSIIFNLHGIASNSFIFQLNTASLAVFLELPFGGSDPENTQQNSIAEKSTCGLLHSIFNKLKDFGFLPEKKLLILENRKVPFNNGYGILSPGKALRWTTSPSPSADFLIEYLKK